MCYSFDWRRIAPGFLLVFAACATDGRSDRDAALVPERDRYGGELVIAVTSDIPSLSTVQMNDVTQREIVREIFVTPMLRISRDLQVEPGLARSWRVNEDTTEIVFHLRDDVYWHDGVKTTAHDLVFAFEKLVESGTSPGVAAYSGVVATDSFSFRIGVATPSADLLFRWTGFLPLPRHLLEDVPASEIPRHPVSTTQPIGNGPYRVAERKAGAEWVFEAVDSYPGELGGRPYLDRIVLRVVPDVDSIVAGLLDGSIDYAPRLLASAAGTLRAGSATRVVASPGRGYNVVGWNQRHPILSDAGVRRALTMAIDRHSLREGLSHGFGQLGNNPVPPFHWAHDATVGTELTYDPERASALLEAAGWADRGGTGLLQNERGEPLRFRLVAAHPSRDVVEAIRSDLRQVGVDVELELLDLNQVIARISPPERDYDAVSLLLVNGLTVDLRTSFHCDMRDTHMNQISGFCDPELDRLLDSTIVTVDRAEARPLWLRLQQRLTEQQPYTILQYQENVNVVASHVENVDPDIRGVFSGITGWWIPPAHRAQP
jgi:peptide/nickel transport system substrate-binding protein